MATLSTAIPLHRLTTAIIVPSTPQALTVSYEQLQFHVTSFQQKLACIGIAPQTTVSIALPNSYEFIVTFLATSWQRAVAAPLNPGFKQGEFEFNIGDLSAALVLVPQDSFRRNGHAIRAARTHKAAIAECYWNGIEVTLDIKDRGGLAGKTECIFGVANPDDIALVLHTSGTTGRPKAVSSRARSTCGVDNERLGAPDPSEPNTNHECVHRLSSTIGGS